MGASVPGNGDLVRVEVSEYHLPASTRHGMGTRAQLSHHTDERAPANAGVTACNGPMSAHNGVMSIDRRSQQFADARCQLTAG
jgi:hypothetical protein